jgi:uncharacterized Zn finger protein
MSWEGRWPPRSRPVRVEGGIKARSRTGAIGSAWWSKRFLDVLESFALGNRLTRGRSYARAGQVLALRVSPGKVTASVQGSRPRPYRVSIGLKPFPARIWTTVEEALAGQAIYSARLLAAEMPPDIEEVFDAAGAPLFPQRLAELRLACTCPDAAVPCKHLAATFYLLAEAFDEDPFQILHWRGRDRESLLGRLRQLRGRAATAVAPATGPVVGAAVALADLGSPPEDLHRFWLPPVPLPPRPPTLDADPDLLLRQLPTPGPALGGTALTDTLRPAYLRFGGSAGGGD